MIYYLVILLSILTTTLYSAVTETEAINKHLSVLVRVKILIEKEIQESQIPGIAIALYDGQQEYFLSFGYSDMDKKTLVTENSLFRIGSITKVFTSTVLASLVIDGKVQLNDPVSKFLKLTNDHSDANKITLLNLSTHTASLPRDFPNNTLNSKITPERIMEFLNGWKTPYPVATQYTYSNLGFQILGMALESSNNTDYMTLLSETILKPLKMNSTFVQVPDQLLLNVATGYNRDQPVVKEPINELVPASGALYSSSSDMLKFMKANLGVDGPKSLINAMIYAQKGFFSISKHLTIGLGWHLFTNKEGLLIINKNGGLPGFSSYIGFSKAKKKVGVVLLTNKRSVDLTIVGRKILKELQ